MVQLGSLCRTAKLLTLNITHSSLWLLCKETIQRGDSEMHMLKYAITSEFTCWVKIYHFYCMYCSIDLKPQLKHTNKT